jgi:Tfp pilus assembly protein PilF
MEQGDFAGASAALDRVDKLDQREPLAFYFRALISLSRGDSLLAAGQVKRAVELGGDPLRRLIEGETRLKSLHRYGLW